MLNAQDRLKNVNYIFLGIALLMLAIMAVLMLTHNKVPDVVSNLFQVGIYSSVFISLVRAARNQRNK